MKLSNVLGVNARVIVSSGTVPPAWAPTKIRRVWVPAVLSGLHSSRHQPPTGSTVVEAAPSIRLALRSDTVAPLPPATVFSRIPPARVVPGVPGGVQPPRAWQITMFSGGAAVKRP